MFTEDDIAESERCETFGPAYFASRRFAETFMAGFEAEHFKPLIKKLADDVHDRLWSDVVTHLASDTESNIQGEMWRQVDATVNALLSGTPWALKRYVTDQKYGDGEAVRAAVAKLVPVELQDKRVADLEQKVAELKKEIEFLRRR